MPDLPPLPESAGQPEQSELSTAAQPIDEFGNPFEIPDFKGASFLNGLFITLIVALIVLEISLVVTIVLKIHVTDLYISEISKISITDPEHQHARSELTAVSTTAGMVSLGHWLLLIITGVCMLVWMFRNYKNSIALAASRLRYSAGAATAGLAIPIMSFYRPYFAVAEMVKIARDRLNWASHETPGYVQLWWMFNIAVIVVSLLTRIITISTPEPVRAYIWNYASSLILLCAMAKNLFLIRIILVIWVGGRRQEQLKARIDLELPKVEEPQ